MHRMPGKMNTILRTRGARGTAVRVGSVTAVVAALAWPVRAEVLIDMPPPPLPRVAGTPAPAPLTTYERSVVDRAAPPLPPPGVGTVALWRYGSARSLPAPARAIWRHPVGASRTLLVYALVDRHRMATLRSR